MESIADAQELLREVGGRWFIMFAEEGLAEWFRAVDVTQLRAREVSAAIPREREAVPVMSEGEVEEGGEEVE
eukprot:10535968-Lingulodinium_polyedra.AAC.1